MTMFSFKTTNVTDTEMMRIVKSSKEKLDRLISKELKKGWQVKTRTHDSEDRHGVSCTDKRETLPRPHHQEYLKQQPTT
jgi:hypothetical protein